MNVNGNGSFLNYNPSSEINIGYSSPGYLNISDGGKFTAFDTAIPGQSAEQDARED
nr:hypothetical protein [Salmonella enterica]